MLTRRQWIASAVVAGVGAGAVNAFGVQPNRVTVSRHRIGQPGEARIRVVQLTDLHLRSVGSHEHQVAETVRELDPQLLVLTGDSIDQRDRLPQLSEFLGLLPNQAQGLAILGNWEHWGNVDFQALGATYERHGIRLLRNESVSLSFAAGQLLVTGLDDLVGGTPHPHIALRDAEPQPNHLLLAHCPAHREVFIRAGAASSPLAVQPPISPLLLRPQLMLAGHTHGGQVRVGGWAPFRPPGSGRYVSGWYFGDAVDLYVSRGLGTSVIPARIGSPPEVALFEWFLAP